MLLFLISATLTSLLNFCRWWCLYANTSLTPGARSFPITVLLLMLVFLDRFLLLRMLLYTTWPTRLLFTSSNRCKWLFWCLGSLFWNPVYWATGGLLFLVTKLLQLIRWRQIEVCCLCSWCWWHPSTYCPPSPHS